MTVEATLRSPGLGAAAQEALASTRSERAAWLRAAADALHDESAALVDIADRETHLGRTRLVGEVARTAGQLRLFADVIEEGSYLEAIVDSAASDAVPPRPELRRMLRPLGVVAVFSASNFPFAFSVAGGDTASALAAGCPVVVKAHSGHPELSRATAELVAGALRGAGAPDGMLSLVEGREQGHALLLEPAVSAVAFTGSVAGGTAIMRTLAERPDPIPFFGELGSLNPVVVTAGALASRGDQIVRGLADSFTLGAGQFCTKPGLVLVPRGADLDAALATAIDDRPAATLLTQRISEAFGPGVERLLGAGDVSLAAGTMPSGADGVRPVVLRTSVENLAEHRESLLEECFGPLTLLVEYGSDRDLLGAIDALPGSLTATVHAEPEERARLAPVIERLANRSGRVVFDGWPTGVAVTWSQHHGGPWPATSTQHTSVGATAIRRFLRPIAYQNAPAGALPADLTDEGLARIPRRRDGLIVLP